MNPAGALLLVALLLGVVAFGAGYQIGRGRRRGAAQRVLRASSVVLSASRKVVAQSQVVGALPGPMALQVQELALALDALDLERSRELT